jgi:integrase
VLPFVDERSGLTFRDLPADELLDSRTLQGLIDTLAVRESAAVARVAAAAIAAVLRDAYQRRLLDELPPRVSLPPPPGGRTRIVVPDRVEKLLEVAAADDTERRVSLLGPLVALLLGTGCRISEALALVWGPDGIDLAHDPPVVRVSRASTKTDAGARAIPLEPETVTVLRRHLFATGRPADGTPVFADEDGQPFPRHRVRSGFDRVAKAAGLPGLTPHELRHTHSTLLAVAGVSAPLAAARLGHADGGALWLRVYAHPRASDGEVVLEALAAARKRQATKTRHLRGTQAG